MGSFPVLVPRQKAQHPQQNRARTRLMQLPPAPPAPRDCRMAPCDLTPLGKAPAGTSRHSSDPPHAVSGGTELSIFSHSAKHQFAAIPRKQALSSHSHHPRAVKAPTAFLPGPTFLHPALIHCSPQAHPVHPFGEQAGQPSPLLHYLPSTPHSPSSTPSHVPQHRHLNRTSHSQTPFTHFFL